MFSQEVDEQLEDQTFNDMICSDCLTKETTIPILNFTSNLFYPECQSCSSNNSNFFKRSLSFENKVSETISLPFKDISASSQPFNYVCPLLSTSKQVSESKDPYSLNKCSQDVGSLVYNKRISSSSTAASIGYTIETESELTSKKNLNMNVCKCEAANNLCSKSLINELEENYDQKIIDSLYDSSDNTLNNSNSSEIISDQSTLQNNVFTTSENYSNNNEQTNENPRENNSNSTEEVNESEMTIDLVTTIDFIIEKTPILTTILLLLSFSLLSGVSIAYIDGNYSHSFLFLIIYIFFLYTLIAKMFKLLRVYHINNLTFSDIKYHEQFYDIADTINIVFIAMIADLKLSNRIQSVEAGVFLLIVSLCMYCVCCRQSRKEKMLGVVKRCSFIIQYIAVIYKIKSETTLSWSLVLFLGWTVIGLCIIKLFTKLKQILAAFQGQNLLSNMSKSSKAIVMTTITLYFANLLIITKVFSDFCKVLDSEIDDYYGLRLSLMITQYLNALILVFTTISGTHLIEFVYALNEHSEYMDKSKINKKLIIISEATHVLKISPTYYKVLNNNIHLKLFRSFEKYRPNLSAKLSNTITPELLESIKEILGRNDEYTEEDDQEDLCYVCYSKRANGVLIDCGHGGVCYECIEDYLKSKDGCMECRKEIKSFLKIEEQVVLGKVYKGSKVCKVIKTI